MTKVHQTASPEAQQMLAALQGAVRNCLERKQRLDQYAVVWKGGKPQRLELSPKRKRNRGQTTVAVQATA